MEYNEHANTGTDVSMSNSGNFEDYEFIPAVIEVNKDPLHFGRIKVSAPGVFNTNNTNPELLPWCYPWLMWGQASYSQMERGAKVWLIKNKKRQDENWYMPMYELHSAAQDFVNKNRDYKPEILSFRNNGASCDYMVYDNNGSYKIACGGTKVNVSGGGINFSSGSGEINIGNDGKVSLGPSGSSSSEPVVIADSLIEILNTFIDLIVLMVNQMIVDSVPSFNPQAAGKTLAWCNALKDSLYLIKSDNVCINESHVSTVTQNCGYIYTDALKSATVGLIKSSVKKDAKPASMPEANVSQHVRF